MRTWIAALALVALATPAEAQKGKKKPPKGFRIKTTADIETDEGDAPEGDPARVEGAPPAAGDGGRPAGAAVPVAKPEADPRPAARPKKRERRARRKKARRKRRRRGPKLKGTGAEGGRKTAWGVVETVTPLEAAERRVGYSGDEIEFAEAVHFSTNSIRVAKRSRAARAAQAPPHHNPPHVPQVDPRGPAGGHRRAHRPPRIAAVQPALERGAGERGAGGPREARRGPRAPRGLRPGGDTARLAKVEPESARGVPTGAGRSTRRDAAGCHGVGTSRDRWPVG